MATMTEAAVTGEAVLTAADRQGLFRDMLLMRRVEERGLSLYKQGKIPGSFYDGRGQEAISVGATWALAAEDVISSPLIRDLGAHLVRGTDPKRLAAAHGIDLDRVEGSGRSGRVTKKDVERFIAGGEVEPRLHSDSPYRRDRHRDAALARYRGDLPHGGRV